VNVIWDLAVHDLSIIDFIMNEAPVAVSATAATHVPGNPENMAQLTLFFESCCIAQISVNWLSPVKVRRMLIGGSRKMIMYDDLEPTEKIKVYDKGITFNASSESARQLQVGYRAGDMWAPYLPAKEALQIETEQFIACIRKAESPPSSALTGLHVIKILEAASRSVALQGSPIQIDCSFRRTKAPEPSRDLVVCAR
jgi:predicted dehydrogenase